MPQLPFVITRDGREPQYFDIYSRLLQDRIVFLQGTIDDESAGIVVAQLRYLMAQDPKGDVHLYVNSPGGSVTAGMGIYDMMQGISCDVATYCIGQASSMRALLLTARGQGQAVALPHPPLPLPPPPPGL